MKINYIVFKDNLRNWYLDKIEFNRQTLLVGASGVGKTQILNTIIRLKKFLVDGTTFVGDTEWEVSFNTDEENNYLWKSKINIIEDNELRFLQNEVELEELYLNNNKVFTRQGNTVKLNEKETPKIDSKKSVITVFNQEEELLPIIKGFEKIYLLDYEAEFNTVVNEAEISENLTKRNIKLKNGFNSTMSLQNRFCHISRNNKELFLKIKEAYINIFPFVEDIGFKKFINNTYIFNIKEKNGDWIPFRQVSSGMAKTLMHLVAIILSEPGSIILIDEFENSLGVNCIDFVTEEILINEKLQFIITSHHPYIINNISMNNWKIVVRKGGNVITRTAQQLKLGKSKHEAFDQLINSKEFLTGVLNESVFNS